MKRLQELKCLSDLLYILIGNICRLNIRCSSCDFYDKEEERCGFGCRINVSHAMKKLFYNRFYLEPCCDSACNTCNINSITDNNNTCGLSIIRDKISDIRKKKKH